MRIGVDIGGTNIKVGLVDHQGKILLQNSRLTIVKRGVQAIIQDIIEQIEELLQQSNTTLNTLKFIGIGVPGLVEVQTGRVIYSSNMFWEDVELGEIIGNYFSKPTYVGNDATIAGLAEKIVGSTKGLSNTVFITLGTGVGGGLIINNKVYSGGHGWGSEIGHMVVGENFYTCNCGQNGCWETFVSATAIIRYANKRMAEGMDGGRMVQMTDGYLENLDGKIIFDAAKQEDALAVEVVDRFIKYLAIGIVNIYNILDPQCIVIGGGLSKAGDFILLPLREEVEKRVFSKKVKYGDIVMARLGNNAGIIGAAFLGESR